MPYPAKEKASSEGKSVLNWRFEGNSIVADQKFASGARRIAVSFDAAVSSCSVRVVHGKESSAAIRYRGLTSGYPIQLMSIEVTSTSCSVRQGNIFNWPSAQPRRLLECAATIAIAYSQYFRPLNWKHFAAPAAIGAGGGFLDTVLARLTWNLEPVGDAHKRTMSWSVTIVQTIRPPDALQLNIRDRRAQIEAPSE
jgi:hypothetical protein